MRTRTVLVVRRRNHDIRVATAGQIHRRAIVMNNVNISLLACELIDRMLHGRKRRLIGALIRIVAMAWSVIYIVRRRLDQKSNSPVHRLIRVQVNLPGVRNAGVDVVRLLIRISGEHILPIRIINTYITRIRRGQAQVGSHIIGQQVKRLLCRSVYHVEARICLIAGRVVVAINHAVSAGAHPEPPDRIGRIVEIVVHDNAAVVRSRRDPHAVLNSQIGIRLDIAIMRRAGFHRLIPAQTNIVVCRRCRCTGVIRLDNPGRIASVTPRCLNAAGRVIRLARIQTVNVEAHCRSITLCETYRWSNPLEGCRLRGAVIASARLQLRRIRISHVEPARCEPEDHEKGEELCECSPQYPAERILVAAHIFLSRSLLSSDLR